MSSSVVERNAGDPADEATATGPGGPGDTAPTPETGGSDTRGRTYPFLRGRAEWISVSLLVAAAVVLRLAYVFGQRESPSFAAPSMDALYHLQWARAFANGEVFQVGPFFRAPLYPWFLGAVLRFVGDDLVGARAVQCLLGGASTLLVYLLGRSHFDRRVAWWAGLAAATYWVSIYFDAELLIPTLAIPLNLAALYFAGRARGAGHDGWALASGLAFGLSAIARPNVLAFVPFLAAWFLFGERGRGFRAALLLVVGTLVPVLPITYRNATIGGDQVLISSQAGVNLWIGNHPGADGSAAIAPGTRADWWGGYYDTIAQAEAAEGRQLRPSEVSRHYARRAAGFVLGSPGESIPLLWRKLRLFWTDWELGNNQDVRFFAFHFSPWLRFTPLRFGAVAAAGLVGLCLSWRRRRELFPLWGFLTVYMLGVVAFFINSRYRLPVVPILLIYGAYALVWFIDAFRARRVRSAALVFLVTIAGAAATRSYPPGLSTDDANGLWQLGIGYEGLAEFDKAEQNLRAALEERPTHPFAQVALGRVLMASGRLPEAIVELEAAARGTGGINAVPRLLDAYIVAERYEDALAFAEKSLERYPDLATIHYAIGRVHFQRSDWAAAREAISRAEQLDLGHPLYPFGVGMAARALGGMDEYRACLERAVEDLRRGGDGRVDRAIAESIYRALIEAVRGDGDEALARELEAELAQR